MKIKILLILMACMLVISPIFALESSHVELKFEELIKKVESKYPELERQQKVFHSFQVKLKTLRQTKQKPQTFLLISQLQSLNDAHIKDLNLRILAESFPQEVVNNPNFQKLSQVYKPLSVNENYEFFQGKDKMRIDFEKYFPVDSQNTSELLKKGIPDGVLVVFSNHSLAVVEDYTYEKHYAFKELEAIFKKFFDTKNPYFIKDQKLIGYTFKEYKLFDEANGIYLSDLKKQGIDPETALLAKDGEKYLFVEKYETMIIARESSLAGVSNSGAFIEQILDDKDTFPSSDTDAILSEIRSTTQQIIKNEKSNDQKISLLYDWVVNNITYNINFQTQGQAPFSGLETYKNRTGVCDGYTKLFFYMLSYAGIADVEIKQGMAFSDELFPKFGHAWVRIGEYYYDPTFDDPIGGDSNTPKHLFFKLPKPLMYADRFDGVEVPESFKNLSVAERKALVLKNKYELLSKYPNYALMGEIRLRKSIGLGYNEVLTLESLKKHLPPYRVSGYQFIDKNGYTRNIKAISFYGIDDKNIASIFQTLGTTNTPLMFLEWENPDKSFDYRLVKEIQYYQ